jgi:Tfp pilus assembly protein PilF
MLAGIPFRMLTLGRPPAQGLLAEVAEQELPAESAADQRARALLLAARPGKANEALTRFRRTLSAGASLTPEEQLHLAHLCELNGDRVEADRLMGELLAPGRETAQSLAAQVRLLLGRGEKAAALRWLKRLQEREPDAPRTRALRDRAEN